MRQERYIDCVRVEPPIEPDPAPPYLIGIFRGEGVGPEVTRCAERVLRALESTCGLAFRVEVGGAIGLEALREGGA